MLSCLSFYFCANSHHFPFSRAAAASVVLRWNTMSDTPEEKPFPLPLSRVWYSGQAASLLVATLYEMDTESSNPPFPFIRVGHCQLFTAHYAWSCPTSSILPLPSSYHISSSALILHCPHHCEYILLSPSSHLFTTSLLLLSCLPRISTAVSSVILVHCPCHIAYILSMYLSTWFLPAFFICRNLHHPTYLPLPSFLFYISVESLMLLYLSSRVSSAGFSIVMHLCCPIPFMYFHSSSQDF